MCNLLPIRKRLGLSQADLARRLEMTQGSITHYENGRQEMPPRVARKLIAVAAELGCAVGFEDIYGAGTTGPEPHQEAA